MTLSERDRERQGPPDGTVTATSSTALCTACAGGSLAAEKVRAAIWEGERLVVIDGIPALVCQTCGEKYYEDETAMRLDFLRGTRFPPDSATHTMTVQVFPFDVSEGGREEG